MKTTAQPTKKATFRAKELTVCPVCGGEHTREQMFQGGGRLIAGALTKELRRLYEKNKKFGRLSPNDYVIMVCPKCAYAAFPKDWSTLSGDEVNRLKMQTNDRKVHLEKILGPIDLNQDRNIVSGAASYLLAIDCYQSRVPNIAPSPKKAVCAIRAAWYFDDLHAEFPDFSFDKVRDILYQKAAIWYGRTLEAMQNGAEPVEAGAAAILGPDTDNNWGFEGVIYLNAYLTLKFKDQLSLSVEKKIEMLSQAKRMLGKIYGSGKSSKSKPSAILDMAKELYEELRDQLDVLGGEK
jgi:uncharacterized protein